VLSDNLFVYIPWRCAQHYRTPDCWVGGRSVGRLRRPHLSACPRGPMSARGVRPPKKETIHFLYASIQICFFSASFLLLLRCYFKKMHLLCVNTTCRASRALCSFMQTRHPEKKPPAGPQFVRPSERPGGFWKVICPPKSTASGALRAPFCPPNQTASNATIGGPSTMHDMSFAILLRERLCQALICSTFSDGSLPTTLKGAECSSSVRECHQSDVHANRLS
jgi:hypothetical protein